jgi:hypothetical protein
MDCLNGERSFLKVIDKPLRKPQVAPLNQGGIAVGS